MVGVTKAQQGFKQRNYLSNINMTKAREEKILLSLLFLSGTRDAGEKALAIMEEEQIDFLSVPIDDLLRRIFPEEKWVNYLCGQLNLHISVNELDRKRNEFVKQITEDLSQKKDDTKYRAMFFATMPIVEEIYSEHMNRPFRAYNGFSATSKVALHVSTLAYILSLLGMHSEAHIRRYLRGVIHVRSKFTQDFKLTVPMLSNTLLVFNYLEYVVKTWYARYGAATTQVSAKQNHWHFELSDTDRLRSNILNMLTRVIDDAKMTGKSRFSVELDMVGEGGECLLYTRFLSKYTILLYQEGYFGKMRNILKEQFQSVANVVNSGFFNDLKVEVERLWEEARLEEFNEDWDVLSIEGACRGERRAIEEIVEVIYGNN